MDLSVKEGDRILVLRAGERGSVGTAGAAGGDAPAFSADAAEVREHGRRDGSAS